jgi:four helix bundle protein
MYGVANNLPETEKFGPASQIRRAAVSLTNNIAEGHGRYRYLDQIKFTLQSRGSLEELVDDLNTCEHEQYLPPEQMTALKKQGWRVWQLIEATSVICGNRLRLPVPELKMRNAGTYMPGLQIFSV